MKIFIILIILIVPIFTCDKKDTALLESAYMKQSLKMLDDFCQKWHSAVLLSNKQSEDKLCDIDKTIHQIIVKFYESKKSEINTPYQIIQNKFFYTIIDSSQYEGLNTFENMKTFKKDSILSFIPDARLNNIKYLCLTSKYENILNAYIYNQNQFINNRNEWKYRDDLRERVTFLANRIYTFPCHWGYPWCLLSGPSIDIIYLSKNLKYAKIEYSIADYSAGSIEMNISKENINIINDINTWLQ